MPGVVVAACPAMPAGQMRYVDLMGGQKPHLLVSTKQQPRCRNPRSLRRVDHSSTCRTELAGTPWITRLPFPVHVVDRVEVYDALSRTRFATRYAYHHGYFDGDGT